MRTTCFAYLVNLPFAADSYLIPKYYAFAVYAN